MTAKKTPNINFVADFGNFFLEKVNVFKEASRNFVISLLQGSLKISNHLLF
jgi:hypothetical protein